MRHTHLIALALTLAPLAVAAAPRDVVVNMRDVEIAQVAEQVSRITGRTLILDPAVRGVVNVVSTDPLPPDGVWDLFRSVLRVQGYAAVKTGASWRIVPQASAIQGGAAPMGAARAQDVVTRVVPLRNLPSEAAVRVFRPLVAAFGSIEALPNPNAIVVTDYAENVRRIERLAQDLDRGGGAGFESLTLKYASARDVGAALVRVMGDGTAPGSPRIAIDERGNMLLIRADPATLAEARRMVAMLDKAGGAGAATRVFRLDYADAETVTEVLRGLAGEAPSPVNAVARALRPIERKPSGQAPPRTSTDGPLPPVDTPPLRPLGLQTPDLSIQPAPELNAIVVRGTPAAIAGIAALIAELDVRRPQVLIEAAIAEVTGDAAEALGIQFAGGKAAVIDGVRGGTSFTNTGTSLGSIVKALLPGTGLVGEGLSIAGGSKGDFSVLVQALANSAKANLLSTPSITTLDNEPAEIVVGQNVPFRTGSFATDGNTVNPFTTIERQDVGITLRVVPRIHQGDSIRLEVQQEVSSLVGSLTGAADLITNRRSIQTTVLADDGDTIVLGGLITDDRTNSRSQVPVLGDVPVLGNLFKSRQTQAIKRTLFVFLRPTILRDRASVVAAAQGKYDRLREREKGEPSRSLLLHPPAARLPAEIKGIY